MANGRSGEDAQALWYVAPGRAELRREAVSSPGPDEVKVRALHGAISRGTERLVLAGRVPPSEYARMRGPNMAGDFPFPVKYGYATVGRVEAGPANLVGRTVFALHPHQSRFVLPAGAVTLVPDNMPPRRAVLAANMETALNATWDAAPGPAGRIAIVGAGVVGTLVAWLCGRMAKTQVTLVDLLPSRGALAQRLGVGFALPADAPRDCDFVFHTSASAAGLATALALAADEASVIELSWYGACDVPVPLGGAFHSRRLRLISSQVGKVAPSRRAEFTPARRLAAAIALLADPALDALLAPAVKFRELPQQLPRLLAPETDVLCPVIDY
ncbi:MAG TPA: zinc-binding alcohol dehydrogenase [Xanthobacteraceae bacterium]|nr:zinc-binding alcohol dehydrogenase [Xanthobacteraceae bacterium]